jgi:hypothetical protein
MAPFALLILLPLFVSAEESVELPECPYIDPIKKSDEWRSFDRSTCNISTIKPEETSDEYALYKYGGEQVIFGVLLSKLNEFSSASTLL